MARRARILWFLAVAGLLAGAFDREVGLAAWADDRLSERRHALFDEQSMVSGFLPRSHAIAMVGPPLYSAIFSHFDYVNPLASQGGTLKLGVTGTFDSLNPFIVRGRAPYGLSSSATFLVYERLMARCWDEPFTLYGLIAETVEVAEDRSAIIFNLNPNARFSDGNPVTADDVLFSYAELRDKGLPNHRTYYKKVRHAEKLSADRVLFVFAPDETGAVDREMPLIMGLMPVLPKHDWQDRDFSQTTARAPIGSGPYTVERVTMGRQIVYRRTPDYWAKDLPVQRGQHNFDKVQVDYYRDDSVSLQAFKAGQYDLRRETDPTKWATSYVLSKDNQKRLRMEKSEHRRTEPAYGYVFNTRRAFFADPLFREALQHSFDFDWVNKTLFFGEMKRVTSFFPNSELAATGAPTKQEIAILSLYKDKLPSDIFSVEAPVNQGAESPSFRSDLLKARKLLEDAGYVVRDNALFSPTGTRVAFEILLSDPTEEKVALNWASSLRRLGIKVSVHTVDSAQYQSRLAAFDFDVTANRWMNSLSPGNEQAYFVGSAAADQKGSRNYAGIKDPVVDALAESLSKATTREELVSLARALDRVLMRGHYFLPLYYSGVDYVAFWDHVSRPSRVSLYGDITETWWSNKRPE